jgi:hypothetical protein
MLERQQGVDREKKIYENTWIFFAWSLSDMLRISQVISEHKLYIITHRQTRSTKEEEYGPRETENSETRGRKIIEG